MPHRNPVSQLLTATLGLCALVIACGAPTPASGATRDDGLSTTQTNEIVGASDIVKGIQESLSRMGLYSGPIDGRMSDAVRDAIESYQKAIGRSSDGKASRELLEHMDTQDKVGVMLKRLETERQAKIEDAKRRLMANENTRVLLNRDPGSDVADPTRNASSCFAKPTERCLLDEAVESAKGIFKSEHRDWAYGEILVSQAKAGMVDQAIQTVRRIGDARLIIVALRDISRALAQEGRVQDARDVAALIPDIPKRLDALAAVAEILVGKQNNLAAARDTANGIIAESLELDDPLKRVAIMSQMAIVLTKAEDKPQAMAVLEEAQGFVRASKAGVLSDPTDRGAAVRHIAAAFADIGEAEKAISLMPRISGEYDKIAVQMEIAKTQSAAGQTDEAMLSASNIGNDRYKAVALGRIAADMAKRGDEEKAFSLVSFALRLVNGIDLPYARSYAAGQIALSLVEIGMKYGDKAFTKAVDATKTIENDQLKAYTLWTIANAQARANFQSDADTTTQLARRATDRMNSTFSQVWMLADVASERIATGDNAGAKDALDRSLTIAQSISNPWGRARALARITATLHDIR
jgi:hypothetical protein